MRSYSCDQCKEDLRARREEDRYLRTIVLQEEAGECLTERRSERYRCQWWRPTGRSTTGDNRGSATARLVAWLAP